MSCGITVKDLYKTYHPKTVKEVKAVRGVSFRLGHGDVLGLIGPSGCGKSTIVKALTGLVTPDKGIASISGRLGFVSQDPYSALCPVMRVGDIVAEPMKFNGFGNRFGDRDVKDVKESFEKVRLNYDKFKDRLPNELSGGERQRIAIARALMAAGGVLILDEPVSMLDYDVKLEITEILRDLVKNLDYAVLLISHDICFVRNIATRVLVMESGQIIEDNSPQKICEEPQNELTRKLVLASLDLHRYLKEGDST